MRVPLVIVLKKQQGPGRGKAEVIEQLIEDIESMGMVWIDDSGWDIEEVNIGTD